jgi:hypothetical protein
MSDINGIGPVVDLGEMQRRQREKEQVPRYNVGTPEFVLQVGVEIVNGKLSFRDALDRAATLLDADGFTIEEVKALCLCRPRSERSCDIPSRGACLGNGEGLLEAQLKKEAVTLDPNDPFDAALIPYPDYRGRGVLGGLIRVTFRRIGGVLGAQLRAGLGLNLASLRSDTGRDPRRPWLLGLPDALISRKRRD